MTVVRFENGKRVISRWDTVFKAISAEPRRQLIVTLLDTPADQSVPLPESSVNPNVPPDMDGYRQELVHQHLPMLADMGFIEWESEPFVAVRGPRFDEVAIVFESLHAYAADIPDSLVVGCQRLEQERHEGIEE